MIVISGAYDLQPSFAFKDEELKVEEARRLERLANPDVDDTPSAEITAPE